MIPTSSAKWFSAKCVQQRVKGREAEGAVGTEMWKLKAKCMAVGLNSNQPMSMENWEKVKKQLMT